jgi:hypothetical protein
MKIHILIAFATSAVLHESRAAALDLNTASGFLLDMLDIGATMADDLGAKVKAGKRLKVDWNLLFGPFTLFSY